MGFAKDSHKAIINVPHELIPIITRNEKNCYRSTADAKLQVTKIEWNIKYWIPSDEQKFSPVSRISRFIAKNPRIKIAYRRWYLKMTSIARHTMHISTLKIASINTAKGRHIR